MERIGPWDRKVSLAKPSRELREKSGPAPRVLIRVTSRVQSRSDTGLAQTLPSCGALASDNQTVILAGPDAGDDAFATCLLS